MLSYLLFIATVGGIYGLLALSLNLIWGGAGMVNLGLAGFFAVGAYASALLTTAGHAPIAVGWLAALVAGGAAGLVVTLSTTRLREDYLAIVTLGFAEVVRLLAANEIWLTRGSDGISGIPGPWKASLGPAFNAVYFLIVVAALAVVFFVVRRIDRSPYGRALRAIREDAQVAQVAGKPVLRFKTEAFVLSAAIAGLAGALYGHFTSYIAPDLFLPLITVYIFLGIGVGLAAGVLGHPALGVAWLANKLGEHDVTLQAGHIVLAGSFTRVIWARKGDTVHGDFGPLGGVAVQFV